MNQEKIGKFIAYLRKEKDMTQVELADKLGITDRAISKWENGRGMPDLSYIQPLCEILEISINELLNGERINDNQYQEKSEEIIVDTITYTDISGVDAAAQFYDMEQASELISYTNATLYVKEVDSSGLIFYHPATLEQNEPGSVYYRHATYTHADTSAPATITNKSTFDICVTAEVQVHNSEGLVFCSSPEFYDKSSDTANIYMGLTADHHCVPIMNNVAVASYILKGSAENSIRYLIANGLIEDTLIGTLNHYLSPIDSYASVDFQIEAAIDTRNSANSAWKSYVKALSDGTYARPVIDVVYTMEEVTRDIENSSYYVSEHGNTYVIEDSTYGKEDFWISEMLSNLDVQEVVLEQKVVYIVPKKVRNKKKVI